MNEHQHVWAGQRVQVLRRFCECGEERFVLDEKKQWPRRIKVQKKRGPRAPKAANVERWQQYAAAYEDGLSLGGVGIKFGVTASQVDWGLKRLGVQRRPRGTRPGTVIVRPPEILARNAEIVELAQSGLTYVEIGKRFDMTRERVRQILKIAGLTPEDIHALIAARHPAPTTFHCKQHDADFPIEEKPTHYLRGAHERLNWGKRVDYKPIADDYAAGMKTKDIMAKYGVSQTAISRARYVYGLPRRREWAVRLPSRAASAARQNAIRADLANRNGQTYEDIGRKHGVSGSLVGRIARGVR